MSEQVLRRHRAVARPGGNEIEGAQVGVRRRAHINQSPLVQLQHRDSGERLGD